VEGGCKGKGEGRPRVGKRGGRRPRKGKNRGATTRVLWEKETTHQMSLDFASNGPQLFPHIHAPKINLWQHFLGYYTDVQASTATMNIHPYSGCHYKRNSGSTPAGMNNLHTRGPAGQQTPGGSSATAPPTARQRPPSRAARQLQRWPQGKRCC
jgi:hypothetical protein